MRPEFFSKKNLASMPRVSIFRVPMFRYISAMSLLTRVFVFASALALVSACGAGLEQRKVESKTHFDLGVVYLNDRNSIMALEELTKAIEKYPKEAKYHNALGLAYFAREMNEQAKVHMKEAIALDPDFSEAQLNLGRIYLEERNWKAGIEASEEALKNIFYKTPEYAHFNIAQANYEMGKYDKAAEGFSRAVRLNPRYVPALYNLGQTYEKLSRVDDAVKAYERAVSISPGFVDAYFKLGMALVKSKDKVRAIAVFNRVIKLSPGSSDAKSAAEYIELLK